MSNAGNGFGTSAKLASLHAWDGDEALAISSLGHQILTFEAPPGNGLSSRLFELRVNNATGNFTVNYSEDATPKVTAITGVYPVMDGRLVLPSISAASLVVHGTGFGPGLTQKVFSWELHLRKLIFESLYALSHNMDSGTATQKRDACLVVRL